jgi:DNA-binding Lrp family transcriptional regulator
MNIRKKRILDGIDKEILRVLYIRRPLVGSQIARCVGLTSSSINSRLINLKNLGIIKISKISGVRNFERSFNNQSQTIISPRYIYWDLDLEVIKK